MKKSLLKSFLELFKAKTLWNIAIYKVDSGFNFEKRLNSPLKVFGYSNIVRITDHIHSCADPFLFVYNNQLYIFFESFSLFNRIANIKAYKTEDLKNFVFVGTVLKKNFHLSYPFIFSSDSSIYMIPESVNANEVALYKFNNFPDGLIKTKVLLEGGYYDSSVIYHNETFYLFTSSHKGLEIFFTKNIEKEPLISHPGNPVTTDPRYCRCGGSTFAYDNNLIRVAQDCSGEYGRNISLFRIKRLNENEYDEELMVEDFLLNNENWNLAGGHHLNYAEFNGNKIITVDGKQNDYLINNFLIIYRKILKIFLKRNLTTYPGRII